MRLNYSLKISKIILPIIAGLLCFVFAPFNKSYDVGVTVINIPWSLIFPIIISIAYGYKSGIIAAVSGGAFYSFILWEENGWANIINSSNIFILIIFVGFIFHYIRNIKSNKKVLLIVTTIITYFLFYSFLYLVAFKYFLSLNPPFWTDNVVNSYPPNVILSIYVKNIVNYALIIMFAEALIKLQS